MLEITPSKDDILAKLKVFNQEHLLDFYDKISPKQQQNILQQIKKIDFPLMQSLIKNKKSFTNNFNLENISAPTFDSLKQKYSLEFQNIGLEALKKRSITIVTLAGGDGSRLQYHKPKGTFKILGKSLFEYQAQQIKKITTKINNSIPWIIITNPKTNEKIISFFKENNYFQLDSKSIEFHKQETLPTINRKNKIILESQDKISFSPNGNGSLFSLLTKKKPISNLQQRNTQYLFVCSIDNPLTRIADPVFLGYTIKNKFPISNKAVYKIHPHEKVGVFVKYLEKHRIIEYSDFPQNELLTSEKFVANIGVHCISLKFILEQVNNPVPYHCAHKKITYINQQQKIIVPPQPNGYKFEKFIFDYFPQASSMGILIVSRKEEFAPLKNKEGSDSIKTVEESLKNHYA